MSLLCNFGIHRDREEVLVIAETDFGRLTMVGHRCERCGDLREADEFKAARTETLNYMRRTEAA